MDTVVSCGTCGLVQRLEAAPPEVASVCPRCGFAVERRRRNSLARTGALALAALMLYFPSNLYPIVTVEYWGAHTDATVFDCIRGLFRTGQWAIGCLVFTTSILTPIVKIVAMLLLVLTIRAGRFKRGRAWLYKTIQVVDPWNMLEVYALSIVVAIVELGKVATIRPGTGAFSFGCVVFLTGLATLAFDPRLIWDSEEQRHADAG